MPLDSNSGYWRPIQPGEIFQPGRRYQKNVVTQEQEVWEDGPEPANPILAAALERAARGVPVFPCHPETKAPLVAGGYKAATTDTALITEWWTSHPDALIGVPTGERTGLAVLDWDPRNDRGEWIAEHRRRMPWTRRHETRSGGEHYVFKHHPGLRCSAGLIAPGIDIRAEGGYIIWWPAHGFAALEEDLADWPEWLLILIAQRQPAAKEGGAPLNDRLPPSGKAVVDLLNRMSNPDEVDRHTYTQVMLAAQGCICALRDAGTIEEDDENDIGAAAVDWAMRWELYRGDDEQAKWESDWSQRTAPLAGWQTLQRIAAKLIPGYGEEVARAEFAPYFTQLPPDPPEEEKPLVLSYATPLLSARKLIDRYYTREGKRTLHHHQGQFHQWTENHYRPIERDEMKSAAYRFLDAARCETEKGGRVRFNPEPKKVSAVLEALAAETQLPGNISTPTWLGTDKSFPPAREILVCANGLLHLPTRKLLPHTPAFFTPNAIDYGFDPAAPDPVAWLQFLRTIWPDDQDAMDALQELFGLFCCSDTAHQKLFLMIGPKRSGKGTIARVLTALLGRHNVANPTLAGLSQNFGLQPLIGKPAAIISDARLGGRADTHVVAERLLSVSGEDGQTIDRKHMTAWTGTLPTRFLILSNELPRLNDASGALAGRFIVWEMTRSFFGQEDHGLTDRLISELPSILNWALVGLDRLRKRGRFVQPASARQLVDELADLASPVGAFVNERCKTDPTFEVECARLYTAWTLWCHEQGRDRPGTIQSFARDLRAFVPGLDCQQRRAVDGKRQRLFRGIGIND